MTNKMDLNLKLCGISTILLVLLILLSQSTFADVKQVTITLNFNENEMLEPVTIFLKSNNSEKNYQFLFTEENQYEMVVGIEDSFDYVLSYHFSNQDDFVLNTKNDFFNIKGKNDIILNFDKSPHGEDLVDNEPVIEQKDNLEELIVNVLVELSKEYEKNYEQINDMLDLYSNETFENYFFEDPNNANYEWESLSNVEKFLNYILIYYPQVCIDNVSLSTNETKYLSNLKTTSNYLKSINNPELANSIRDVWKYHFKQWSQNGVFVVLKFSDIKEVIQTNQISYENSDPKILKTESNLIQNDLSFWNVIKYIVIRNKITLPLLLIVLIIAAVLKLKMYLKEKVDKKENESNEYL